MLHTIRAKLLIGIIVPLLGVYCSVAILETRRQIQTEIKNAEQLMRERVEKRAAICDTTFSNVSMALDSLGNVFSTHIKMSKEGISDVFIRCLSDHPELLGIGVGFVPKMFDGESESTYLYSFYNDGGDMETQFNDEFDYFHRDWYSIACQTEKRRWSEPYLGAQPKVMLMCSYSVPFYYEGKLAGIIFADFALDDIRAVVQADVPQHSAFRLFSTVGTVISDANPELEMEKNMLGLAEQYQRPDYADFYREMLEHDSGVRRILPLDANFSTQSELHWIVYARLKATGWTLTHAGRESHILAPVYVRLHRQICVFGFGLILIVSVIVYVSDSVGKSLKRLTDFAEELARGNLDAKIRGRKPNDEIGLLAHRFDQMVVELNSNIELRIKEETARKMVEGELQVARRIQASLLPRIFPPFPHRKEFELHAMSEPATFIAGDFFDYFFVDHNTLGIVIADVSGHGVPAAMFMAVTRTAVRNFATADRTPSTIIKNVNEILVKDNDDNMFVTMFFGLYDVSSGVLRYVNAGHNPPYILKNDGSLQLLKTTCSILAMFEETQCEEETVTLEPNEILFSFTDGVTEAHTDATIELFGQKRLEALLRTMKGETVDHICDIVHKAVSEHSHNERHDDITLLVLKRTEN